jgi:hypothetical protein
MNLLRIFLSINIFPPDAPTKARNESLLIVERAPGMHQVVEDEDCLSFNPQDVQFLRALRISGE